MRLVSFDPILRPEMDKARINKSSIAILNCQVKQQAEFNSGSDSTFEILASSRSKLQTSPHKFNLPQDFEIADADSQPSPQISINEVDDLSTGQHVCVLGKVVQSDSPMPVQNKSGQLLHKQECIMADESAQIRLVLWEDDINK